MAIAIASPAFFLHHTRFCVISTTYSTSTPRVRIILICLSDGLLRLLLLSLALYFFCSYQILGFIESRMSVLAPNVTALVGSGMAALLIGRAGGLVEMANMPSCNLQVGGEEKKRRGK